MRFKNFAVEFMVLLLFWILLNNTLNLTILFVGIGLSAFLALILCRNCDIFSEVRLNPKAILYTLLYLFLFLVELIKSNLDVAYRVISPSLPINPGIVEVKTRLNSKMGRMILANSITLTPGTLTVGIHEDTLRIHWIDIQARDMQEATDKIVRKFEKYLEVIYG